MKFITEDQGTWFYFDEDDEKKGGVKIRILRPSDYKEIAKKTQKKRSEYRRNQRYEWFDTDTELEQRLTWDYCIVDWTGVEGADGKEMKCTKENKSLLMDNSMQFLSFVTNALDVLNQDQLNRESDSEKN